MIEAEVVTTEGFPSVVKLRDGNKNIEVFFERNVGFKIKGSRRSLTPEMIDLLRLVYPARENPRHFYDSGSLVSNNVDVSAGAAEVITELYTVPGGKKLFLLNSYLCLSDGGGGSPYGDLHVYDPSTGNSFEPIGISWDVVNTDVQTIVVPEIEIGFPTGFIVRTLTGLNTNVNAGFIGALKDA